MKQDPGNKGNFSSPFRTIVAAAIVLLVVVAMTPIFYDDVKEQKIEPMDQVEATPDNGDKPKDSIGSIEAFGKVYKVLMSPRCMNCHPSGDVPLQGEDSHLHTMSPRRGKDGKGLYAMKCSNCHQATNSPGLHAPPGNPEWHLPPADMKMVFEGRTPGQLARQLVNPEQNGHKTLDELLEHVSDTLVIAGWHPAEGLEKPPLTYEEFKAAWIAWIEKGAFAPKQ
jgi:hypothetical protein